MDLNFRLDERVSKSFLDVWPTFKKLVKESSGGLHSAERYSLPPSPLTK